MTRSAAAKAEQAADAVQAWLEMQKLRPDRPPVEEDNRGQPEATVAEPYPKADSLPTAAVIVETPARDGRTGGLVRRTMPHAPSLRSVHTDWLHHRLHITGTSGDIAALRHAAAGAGIIPWQLDLDRAEEDFFHLLVAPAAPQQRSLSLDGARILSRQLRDAVERRHQIAVARVGRSRACLFDLHALLPVPDAILRLGPDEPETLAWLWEHWGTPEGLRHVAEDPASHLRQKGASEPANFAVTFWSADWTPWRALATLERRWPALRFAVRPSYDRA